MKWLRLTSEGTAPMSNSVKRAVEKRTRRPPLGPLALAQQARERKKALRPLYNFVEVPRHVYLEDVPPDPLLRDFAVQIQLSSKYPQDMFPQQLENYAEIYNAFAHCFGPHLFFPWMIPAPANLPYWADFFQNFSPGRYILFVQPGYSSNTGDFTPTFPKSGRFSIYDQTGEPDIFHEIGHALMRTGIERGVAPLYYQTAFSGNRGDPSNPNNTVVDAKIELHRLFGNSASNGMVDGRKDIDGSPYGFVSDYASSSAGEDFAETLKYYVYFSDDAYDRAARQSANGSNWVWEKLGYVSRLYSNMYFKPGGEVDAWLGYSL